jgi:hypothetical protein
MLFAKVVSQIICSFNGKGAVTVILVFNAFGLTNPTWKFLADNFRPTSDELVRGIVHQAPPHWGINIRNSNSFRILTLGGSNTAFSDLYVDKLRSLVQNCSRIDVNNSYVINEGVGGHGPMRKRYFFEDYPPTRWPNIVTLEFAVNSANDWSAAQSIDDFIYFLNAKYSKNALSPPSYLIIELFAIGNYYPDKTRQDWKNKTQIEPSVNNSGLNKLESRLDLNPRNSFFNRGTRGGACIDALARFYGYPLVSLTDAMFPSFLRYYTTYSDATMWPYSRDGIHISPLGGSILVEHILFPFLLSELEPRDTDHLYQNVTSIYGNVDFRMFPKKSYSGGFVAQWAPWGGSNINSLRPTIIESSATLVSIPGHNDGLHNCYGESKKGSVIKIGFNIDSSLLKTFSDSNPSPYRLRVGFVFSWNESFIGKALCGLFETFPNNTYILKREQIGKSVELSFNTFKDHKVHDTTLREVVVFYRMPLWRKY